MNDMNVYIMDGRSNISRKVNSIELDGNADRWRRNKKLKHNYISNVVMPNTLEVIHLDKEGTDYFEDFVCSNSRWIRDHVEPRDTLFFPLKVDGGPCQFNHFPELRLTLAKAEGRSILTIDSWKKNSKIMSPFFVGLTAFVNELPKFVSDTFLKHDATGDKETLMSNRHYHAPFEGG